MVSLLGTWTVVLFPGDFKHVNIAANTGNKCFPDKNTIMAVNSNLKNLTGKRNSVIFCRFRYLSSLLFVAPVMVF